MKSNVNDAELIAEAYATNSRSVTPEVLEEFLPAIAAVARTAVKAAPVVAKVAAAVMDSEDQELSCGYDQVAEPEPQVDHVDESEINVALSDLYKVSKYAAALTDMLGSVGSLEGWTAVKVAKAADYLGAVFHQLDYDQNGHSMQNTGHEDAPAEDNQ